MERPIYHFRFSRCPNPLRLFQSAAMMAIAAIPVCVGALSWPRTALASGQDDEIIAAIQAFDVRSLEMLANEPSVAADANVARGVLAAYRGDDDKSIQALKVSAAAPEMAPELRHEALQVLAGVYARDGRFSDAAATIETSEALGVHEDPDDATSSARALASMRALSNLAPMGSEVSAVGEVPIERGSLGFPRATVTINGRTQQAVLDTGASNSVVSKSTADRLGLRILEKGGAVQSDASIVLLTQYAVADTLNFAGGTFHSVPFIVLPDQSLTITDETGPHALDVIIGLPVLRRLGRLEFIATRHGESLRRRSAQAAQKVPSNLILTSSLPIVMVSADGADAPLRMALDTGGNRSSLTPLAATDFPKLVAGATLRATKRSAVGGMVTDEATQIVPNLTLHVDGETARLSSVPVTWAPCKCHGVIGQDVLRLGAGYVIDFNSMRLEILPRAN